MGDRTTYPERRAAIEIPPDPSLFGVVRSFVGTTSRAWRLSEEVSSDAQVAISEALAFASDTRVRVTVWPGGSGDLMVRLEGCSEPSAGAGSMGQQLLTALSVDLRWTAHAIMSFRIAGL